MEPSVGQQPLIAGSHSSVADESPSRVQIIDNVLIRSRNSNPNGIVGDDSTVAEVETNATESEAQYFYAFEEGRFTVFFLIKIDFLGSKPNLIPMINCVN